MSTIHQKDTTFTKIFVGGLPYHTTDQSLREFFEQFGDIEEAVVITDRQTGKSRGYGFVTMSDRVAAERACKDPNPIIDGRKANVNLAYLGAKPRIQAGAFPLALKTGIPGYLGGQIAGIPQYVYPSAYMTSPGVIPVTPQSPLSPTAAATSHLLADYTAVSPTAAAAFPTSQLPAGYEAAYPYTTTAGYATPAANYYAAAAAVAQPLGHLTAAHYQPQQIQERLQ